MWLVLKEEKAKKERDEQEKAEKEKKAPFLRKNSLRNLPIKSVWLPAACAATTAV